MFSPQTIIPTKKMKIFLNTIQTLAISRTAALRKLTMESQPILNTTFTQALHLLIQIKEAVIKINLLRWEILTMRTLNKVSKETGLL